MCPTRSNPIDGSPPGSPVPGILQARTLEWVAITFSNAWKWKMKVKSLSRVRLLATPWTAAHQAPLSMGFSRQECWSGVSLPSLLINTRTAKFLVLMYNVYGCADISRTAGIMSISFIAPFPTSRAYVTLNSLSTNVCCWISIWIETIVRKYTDNFQTLTITRWTLTIIV